MLFQARQQFPETIQAFPEVFDKVSRIGRAKTKIELILMNYHNGFD